MYIGFGNRILTPRSLSERTQPTNIRGDTNRMSEPIQRATEIEREHAETVATRNELKQYNKQLRNLFVLEKKWLKKRAKVYPYEEPVLFLTRTDGTMDRPYQGVKGGEFMVPGLPDGVEKKIILGRQFQVDIPHGESTIKAYFCHEDWAFPFIWGKPNKYREASENEPAEWYLTSANIASEVFRDRERKVLMAWEKFQSKASKKDWVEIAKAIAIVIGVIVVALWAWNQFFAGDPQPAVAVVGNTGVEL